MKERCPFCGNLAEMVWVRAHYQCAYCGQVAVPCCNGETARDCLLDAESVPDQPALRPATRQRSDALIGKAG